VPISTVTGRIFIEAKDAHETLLGSVYSYIQEAAFPAETQNRQLQNTKQERYLRAIFSIHNSLERNKCHKMAAEFIFLLITK
jgi:hypothetical protein